MGVHDGHRQRLKERFRREGLDNFDELYVLELMLFYCVPRQDTNPLAHRLLDHFGSLVDVMNANPEELEKVPGVSCGISTFLSLHSAVEKYYQIKLAERQYNKLDQWEAYCHYLQPHFKYEKNEVVYMLCLDGSCKVISCKKLGEGGICSANVPIRRIVEIALSANATSVILAHNHPAGISLPSQEDIASTVQVSNALDVVDVVLSDHVVFSDTEYTSLAVSGYYRYDGRCFR